MKRKVLLTSGGTGGHIFPALAVAKELQDKYKCEVLFAGGNLSQNPFFETQFNFQDVACAPWKLSLTQFYKGPFNLVKGVSSALHLIRTYKPDFVVGFGSFYTLPVLVAAKIAGVPLFLDEQNSIPGKVNRLFSPLAECTFIHFPTAQQKLMGKSQFGAFPLRSQFKKGLVSAQEARKAFQLDPDVTTILVFGGSQGAKRINRLFSEAALFHIKDHVPDFQVLHFTGDHTDAELLMQRYVNCNIGSYVRPFEKRMELAWAAADIAVTRAGAASIAEQIEFEVPGVLIPYPFATDKHQDINADFLADAGLAVKANESDLTPQILAYKVRDALVNILDKENAFKKFKNKYFSNPISDEIIQWITKHKN